ESASAPVAAEEETGPEDDPTPPNVPRIGGKPALKVVK
ncbi:ClpXP protease specificity-enhancing factor, partial [Ralstonia sp. 1B3]